MTKLLLPRGVVENGSMIIVYDIVAKGLGKRQTIAREVIKLTEKFGQFFVCAGSLYKRGG